MTQLDSPTLESLLAETDWLKALARQLVRDEDRAEDLVQETVLAALKNRHRVRGAPRPWLRRVAHNAAGRLWRRESQREQRERSIAKAEGIPSAAETVEHFATLRTVVEAVRELPEPYHTTILLRYYQDLPPRQIAVQMQVPVETVKTRLTRGLAKLRDRLDQEFGNREGWVPILVPALESVAGRGTGLAASGFAGLAVVLALVRSPMILSAAGLLLTGAVGFLVFGGPAGDFLPGQIPSPISSELDVDVASAGDGGDAQGPNQGLERQLVREPGAVSAVVLKGRIVDPFGSPLADAHVVLSGYTGLRSQSVWVDPEPIRTGAHGLFEFRFILPATHEFRLDVSADGRVPMMGGFPHPEADVTDLGDVVMQPGSMVRGRILAPDDMLRNHRVNFRLTRKSAPRDARGLLLPREPFISTRSDGTFRSAYPVLLGRWNVVIPPEVAARVEVLGPEEVIAVAGRDVYLEFRAGVNRAMSITGVVVDDQGKPIGQARVGTRHSRMVRTSPLDGSFVLDRANGDPSRVSLVVAAGGYDILRMTEEYAWGAKGLRLVPRRGAPVELTVTDEAGRRVDDFVLQIDPTVRGDWQAELDRVDSPARETRRRDGVAHLEARRGRYHVLVDPAGDGLADGVMWNVEIGEDGAKLEVELSRSMTQRLKVHTEDGLPVAGAKVELLESLTAQPVRLATPAYRPGQSPLAPDSAFVWQDGVTDASGELDLIGPGDREFSLRIRAPGHPHLVRSGVVLEQGGEPIVVEVSASSPSATISGTIRPKEFLSRLEQAMALAPDERPGVQLLRAPKRGDRGYEAQVGVHVFPVLEDGSFQLASSSTGDFDLCLGWFDGRYRKYQKLREIRGLRAGERRQVDLDLSHFVFSEVRGDVLIDGKPAAGGYLVLRQIGGKVGTRTHEFLFDIDDSGGFAGWAAPGEYRAIVSGGGYRSILCAQRVDLQPGQLSEPALRVDTAQASLQIVGSDGRPRSGVELVATFDVDGSTIDFDEWGVELSRSDDTGEVEAVLPAGPLRLWVMPKHLTTLEGLALFREQGGTEADWRRAWVPIGDFEFRAEDAGRVFRVLLPDAAGY